MEYHITDQFRAVRYLRLEIEPERENDLQRTYLSSFLRAINPNNRLIFYRLTRNEKRDANNLLIDVKQEHDRRALT